jgi:hypothetical protein
LARNLIDKNLKNAPLLQEPAAFPSPLDSDHITLQIMSSFLLQGDLMMMAFMGRSFLNSGWHDPYPPE